MDHDGGYTGASTMKISTQSIENSEAKLQIEVEPVEMEESLDRAYHQVVKKVGIPGFRKGKAPRSVLESYIGKDGLQREALEDLVPRLCARAIEEQNIEVIAQPQIEIMEMDPVVFKATFALRPTVELGDYHGVRIAPQPVEVSDEEINNAIDRLRERHAVWSPVERPVEFEDMATIDIEEEVKETGAKRQQRQPVLVAKGSLYPLPGFPEYIEGMVKDEEKEFTLSYPDDYRFKELGGKEFSFKVKVVEVKEKHLPDLDDEFVRSLGQSWDDVEALSTAVASNLKKAAEEAAGREHERRVMEAVAGLAKVEFPSILVDQEIDSLLKERDMIFRQQGGLEGYLRSMNKTEQDLREEFRPEANRRVTESLVLGKVAEQEKITVDGSEVDAEIEDMMQGAGDKADDLQRLVSTVEARHVIEDRLVTRKTLQLLVGIAERNDSAEPEKDSGEPDKDSAEAENDSIE
jgi:trigger factor